MYTQKKEHKINLMAATVAATTLISSGMGNIAVMADEVNAQNQTGSTETIVPEIESTTTDTVADSSETEKSLQEQYEDATVENATAQENFQQAESDYSVAGEYAAQKYNEADAPIQQEKTETQQKIDEYDQA